MKSLVLLTLCSTLRSASSHLVPGLCDAMKLQCNETLLGSYCPQCDARGDFLPQQCWPSTGYCWCVDVHSGEEVPGTSTPPGTQPVNCGELDHWSCPDGWSSFGETCFTFISSPRKWVEAEVYCQFDGGNLASIHSKEENHFIMSLTRGFTHNFPQTWLGGFDAVHPGYWMWSDGSDFNYENWADNPHEDKGGDDDDDDSDEKPHDEENCLKINYEYDLKWFHDSCLKRLPFVCAKAARRAR